MGAILAIPFTQSFYTGISIKEVPCSMAFGSAAYTSGTNNGFIYSASNFTATPVATTSIVLNSASYSSSVAYAPQIAGINTAYVLIRVTKISGGTVTEAATNEVNITGLVMQTSSNLNP